MMTAKRLPTRLVALLALCGCLGVAEAQPGYPTKPIRIITPFPSGGSTTTLGRLIGQKLTDAWGQSVVVDNRPGGNMIIGTDALVRSPADGHTLLLTISNHVVVPQLLATPYDISKDFAAVGTLASSEEILVLTPSLPPNNLREFIALAKAKPGKLNYASSGTGGMTHLATELFNIMADVKLQNVPYKGGAPALVDLIGGQVDLSFQPPTNVIAHVKAGKLKAIAVSGERRLAALPQVPTFTEAGLPDFDVKLWFGILAPAGTPAGIVDKLSGEFAKILAMPDFRERLLAEGMDPFFTTPAQFSSLIRSDAARFANVIRSAKIRLEN